MGFDPSQPRDKEGKWARVKGALRRFATVETAVKLGTLAAGVAIAHSLKNQQSRRMQSVRDEINKRYTSPSGPKMSLGSIKRAANRATDNFAATSTMGSGRGPVTVDSLIGNINALKQERSTNAKHAASMKRSIKASVASAKGRIK